MLINDEDLTSVIDYLKNHRYIDNIENATAFLKEGINNLIDQKHDFKKGKSIKNTAKALLAMIHSDRSLDSYSDALESLAKILTPMLKIEPAKIKDRDEIKILEEAVTNLQKIRMALAGTYRYNAPSNHQTTNQQHARTEPHSHTQYSTDHTSASHQQRHDYYKHMQEEIRRKLDEQLRREQEEYIERMKRQQQETQAYRERMKRQQQESYQQTHNQDAHTRDENDNPFKKPKTWNNYYGSNRESSSLAEMLRQQNIDLSAGNQSYAQYRQKTQQEENQSTHKFTEHSSKQADKSSIYQEIKLLSDAIKNATSELQDEYLKMQQAYNDLREFSNSKIFADLVASYKKISGASGIYWELHKKIDHLLTPTIKTHLENQIKDFEKIYDKIYDKATILRDHDAPNLRDQIDKSQNNNRSSRRN